MDGAASQPVSQALPLVTLGFSCFWPTFPHWPEREASLCLVSVVTGFQVSLFARTKPEINMAKSRESRNRELTRGYGRYRQYGQYGQWISNREPKTNRKTEH